MTKSSHPGPRCIKVCEPIDAPLFNHLSDAKRNEIDKYRADYRGLGLHVGFDVQGYQDTIYTSW